MGVSQARSHCEVPSVPGQDIRPTRTLGTSQVLNTDSPTPQGPWMTCSRTPPTHTYEASPQDEPSVAGDGHGWELASHVASSDHLNWPLTEPASADQAGAGGRHEDCLVPREAGHPPADL